MLVLGDEEAQNGTYAVRSRKDGNLGTVSPEAFLERITVERDTKAKG